MFRKRLIDSDIGVATCWSQCPGMDRGFFGGKPIECLLKPPRCHFN